MSFPFWFSNPRLECLDCTGPAAPGKRRCLDCLEIHNEKARQQWLRFKENRKTPRCTMCGRRGHYAKTCGTGKERIILSRSCTYCGEKGHYAKTCQKRKQAITESLLKRSLTDAQER